MHTYSQEPPQNQIDANIQILVNTVAEILDANESQASLRYKGVVLLGEVGKTSFLRTLYHHFAPTCVILQIGNTFRQHFFVAHFVVRRQSGV